MEKETLSQKEKDILKEKLRLKLRNKKTSRLSRPARELMMDKIEEKMEKAKGKELIRLKRELRELEDIEDKEMNNEAERTIPNYTD